MWHTYINNDTEGNNDKKYNKYIYILFYILFSIYYILYINRLSLILINAWIHYCSLVVHQCIEAGAPFQTTPFSRFSTLERAESGWNRSFVMNRLYERGFSSQFSSVRALRRIEFSERSGETCGRAKTISRIDLRLACGTHKRIKGLSGNLETCVSHGENLFTPYFAFLPLPFSSLSLSLSIFLLLSLENFYGRLALRVFPRKETRNFHRLFSLDTRSPDAACLSARIVEHPWRLRFHYYSDLRWKFAISNAID